MLSPLQMPTEAFPQFFKRLIGFTLPIQLLAAVIIGIFWPDYLLSWCAGVGLGWFYLLSLKKNVSGLLQKNQWLFSSGRTLLFAGLIVLVGRWDLYHTTIVLIGCFSYKLGLLASVLATFFFRQNSSQQSVPFSSSEHSSL